MDWLRQIPMGQYVDGREGWLRRLDARLKLAWSLVFLLTPVLAGPLCVLLWCWDCSCSP